ncbi:MAG: prolyl oligopeptidase family serine peptidase, partial [Bacteroidota bacterium]
VQLADSTVPDVTIPMKGDAEMALGTSNRPYQMEISWDWPGYRDAYAVNVETGQRRLLLEKIQSGIQASPTGAYAAWWDGEAGAWMAVSLMDGDPIDLTADIDVRFDNEEHDWPYRPNPYGSAGWTEDDRFVVYDRFDLWALDPEGASPMLLTEGLGREEGLQFRFVDLDRDEPVLPDDLLLYTFDDATKSAGYYEADSDEVETPERLVFGPYRFGRVKKAKNADQLVYTRESFEEFPNLWTGSDEFEDTERLTDLNPQQADYNWGTVELVEWTSTHGDDLQGILVKPENFDPAKEYPLMVYYYEKSSDNLHRHWTPEAHRSIINFSFYASRGYLIFIPDIPYRIGYPGESALHAVLSGTMHVVGLGNVDRDRIGMQGHSWGGYQAAYLATRTNLFRAIEAGAPVSNMFSAYGGIRYRTGMSRMFQYERTQSRIGGTMWEMPLRYIENSPIFWADKIETPLLIMHNDEDGAVPFTQGVELFVALRRLEKPSWLINYTGEPHWPT